MISPHPTTTNLGNMASSFYEQIGLLLEPDWNYYFGSDNNVPINKPFVTSNPAKAFIRSYFKKGGKEWISDAFDLDHLEVRRAEHTVAVFFFGALLFKNTDLSDKEFFNGKVDKWYEFKLFMWFVTCLAHDVSYTQEREKGIFINASTVEELYDKIGIEHKLFEREIAGVPADFLSAVKPYFTFRHKGTNDHRGVTDHGIHAGVLAYDILVKNRIKKKESESNDSLYWADDLDPFYAIAAATIATHNIWLPETPQAIEDYRKAELGKLIGRDKIKFHEGPLLYFLGLIDTIDPVKAYWDRPVSEVLRHIQLDYTNDTVTLIATGELDPAILLDKAKKAEAWLAIHFEPVERGVTIRVKLD